MNLIKRSFSASMLMMLLTLAACVTINVYFPAAQAEKAAERIVDEILGNQPQSQPEAKEDKGAYLIHQQNPGLIAGVFDLLIPSAQAAQPDFSVNTPEIRRLKSSMSRRNSKLSKYYKSGAIGFTNNGQVAIRDSKAVSLKQRAELNSLIRAENKDRKALYRAVAKANNHPEWESQVRDIFAKKWVQKARSGWWYQTSSGSWKQK